MKRFGSEFVASLLVAVGLVGAAVSFALEARSFRAAVRTWAQRDLEPRTELASSSLREPLETGDFRRGHAFGEQCAAEGVRFPVFSAPGGLVFDSAASDADFPEAIYVSRPCGDFKVRLGLPLARVMAPFRRARLGFLLAAAVGGAGVLLVFLFTYRQRMRLEEMRKLERFRRDFIADVSHELKTPLTGILGAVELLSDDDGAPDPKLLEMIRSQSVRLNGLAQGILALSRLERAADLDAVRKEPLALDELVREAVERQSILAQEKGMSITFEPPAASVTVRGDATLIAQVVDHLIVNAIRHSGSKDVVVTLGKERGQAVLAVEDHGRGIPEADRPRIFERFYRVDASRTSATGGSGLGLAIVRRIATLHGGTVVLEPVRPSGCRFVLRLPA